MFSLNRYQINHIFVSEDKLSQQLIYVHHYANMCISSKLLLIPICLLSGLKAYYACGRYGRMLMVYSLVIQISTQMQRLFRI